ncbi:MAG: 1,4-dihydroxy-2-naphthoate polyprenyltransferase [Actinomyces succiniciruminis]|uniref:1,4-dihydroxy-2-naphthoate octaprenyltransferase n=1 Tax=Actinomyces succiniciruminis TaxID=1522002 RepID=A0A1L7R836_9ACTO|nr:1,4-dihydroxy-2-naphthoate polyprenyltransferase [Actinomyces succiniciruminis]MBM6980496.1 1,4-dihydroxy-2-naphthoate polyprenyltransferase [Actinomyces succiniciruminis]CED90005.1 1,4-dihydroxy-2-naphthoate octaprenyltransferase [Actinomyces succiniciruminis]
MSERQASEGNRSTRRGGQSPTGPAATSWMEVVRLRTLPAAVAPVILGAGAAAALGGFSLVRTLLAAGVALALQIGSNLANDYSDGVRGTDDDRTGPPRLTASGQVAPRRVKYAAFGCFGLGALFGLALVALSGQWWLVAAGAAAVAAAWFYTGGSHPYGYMGLGEVFVFIFFGLMATGGTVYVQTGSVPGWVWLAASGIGLIACSLLMVNNLRDIDTDPQHGKRTLAVRLGERGARRAFVVMVCTPVVMAVLVPVWARADLTAGAAEPGSVWRLLALVAVLLVVLTAMAARTLRPVLAGATGRALIPALRDAGLYELAYGVVLAVALVALV